jgi:large subunit ribosomal protein L28
MNSLTRPFTNLRLAPSSIPLPSRPFSTSSTCLALSSVKLLTNIHAKIPPYPYGPSRWYKQSNYGLYAGRKLQFGNNVSKKNEIKTRRKWEPNVRFKRIYSEALDKYIRVRLVTRVLRTIDKCGGLDNYLLGSKARRIKDLGMGGWALRWRIMRTPLIRKKMARERKRLGLTGPAPWEISSWEEALEAGWDPNMVGYTEDYALEVEQGIDQVLDADEGIVDLGAEGEAELEAANEPPEEVVFRDGKFVNKTVEMADTKL